MKKSLVVAVCTLGLLGAGCAGARQSLPPATPIAQADSRSIRIPMKLRIKIPRLKHGRAALRQRVIVAQTAGLVLNVYPAGERKHAVASIAANIGSSSPYCDVLSSGRQCVIAVDVPTRGPFDFVVATYDQAPQGGSIPSSAHQLGYGITSMSVTPGRANSIGITIGGVLSTYAFGFVQDRKTVPFPTFPAIDSLAFGFSVAPYDADGNVIVGIVYDATGNPVPAPTPQPDANWGSTFSVSSGGWAHFYVVYDPNKATAAQLQNGFTASFTMPGAQTPSTVSMSAAAPVITTTPAPGAPWDISSGFYTLNSASAIGKANTSGNATTPTASSKPYGIATDLITSTVPSFWFAECAGNKIGVYYAYVSSFNEFPITTPSAQPHYITVGNDENRWFTETAVGQIGRMTTSGVLSEFSIPSAGSNPEGIATGAGSGLTGVEWFAESGTGKIASITNLGSITEYSVPSGPASGPYGILVNGTDVWFTERNASKIGRFSGGAFTEYPTPTASSGPTNITLGPGGAIYFAETNAHKIGRISPGSGTIAEFSVPASPFGIDSPYYTVLYQYGNATEIEFTDPTDNLIGTLQ